MNWDAVGAIGEVIGALGVVASLVYLARQIGQNSSLVEQGAAAARGEAAAISAGHGADAFRRIAADPELTRIWTLGTRAPGELRDDELRRFDLLVLAQLIEIDANYSLVRTGVLDREIWEIWDRVLEFWTADPRFQRRWREGELAPFVTAALGAHIREKLAARGVA